MQAQAQHTASTEPFEVGHYDREGTWFTLAGTWGCASHELAAPGFGPVLGRFSLPQGGYVERPMSEEEKRSAFARLRTRRP